MERNFSVNACFRGLVPHAEAGAETVRVAAAIRL